MEKHMVQCEDGRRRQARIHGMPREEGDFRIWIAGAPLESGSALEYSSYVRRQ